MDDRYLIISADGHAGADLWDYGPYLDARWRDEFEGWASTYVNPYGNQLLSETVSCNWDSDLRRDLLETDGIVAEVIFPNTVPPFFPRVSFHVPPPPTERSEYERRWAGLRAHNRWLADFCAALPGRRAGVAQVMLNDLGDTLDEVRWVKEVGLMGGILLPGVPPGSTLPGLWSSEYEPLWAACEDLGVPVHLHGGAGIPDYGDDPRSRTIMHTEFTWFTHRALWHLIFGGVFERHPRLTVIFTEVGAGWIPPLLAKLDAATARYRLEGSSAAFFGAETVAALQRRPSEYFARNVFVGASFLHRDEAELRYRIGIDHLMWGSDFPHIEGSYPYSREALRATFSAVPTHEIRRMLSVNAAARYGFDLEELQHVADQVGPTVSEVATPLDAPPASFCYAFAPPASFAGAVS